MTETPDPVEAEDLGDEALIEDEAEGEGGTEPDDNAEYQTPDGDAQDGEDVQNPAEDKHPE